MNFLTCIWENQSQCIYTQPWFAKFFFILLLVLVIFIIIRKKIKQYWYLLLIPLAIFFLHIPVEIESVYDFPYEKEETSVLCEDTDFGSIWKLGTCTDVNGQVEDKCIDDYKLEEFTCYNNLCMKKIFRCQCIKGKCVPISKDL